MSTVGAGSSNTASGGATATSAEEDANLYDVAVPDPENTLGGIKDDVEPEHPSVIGHLVKSLMPGQDLTRVTIPPFFLEPRSLLERMADMLMHPELLVGVSALVDPVQRMLAVTKWYLSGWHYKTVGVQKPFNPVVGETFACFWKHEDGSRSQYFAEQVLHRPPISAIYFENRPHNVAASAHVWTKSQFSAPQTTKSILDGACILTLTNLEEEYYITFPTYFAHNLILGTLRMEVGDTAHIVCSKTHLRCDVSFHQRSMWSDAALNGVDAVLYRTSGGSDSSSSSSHHYSQQKGEELYHFAGHWDREITCTPKGGKASPFLDVSKLKVSPKYVLPLSLQGPWESRKLWAHASAELLTRPKVDWEAVDREKGQLEEEQRLLACHAKVGSAEYADWVTKKFHGHKIKDEVTGHVKEEFFKFDHFATGTYEPGVSGGSGAAAATAPALNVLALSRNLPDPRGGRGGAGGVPDIVKATRSIKMSAKRQQDFAAQDAEAK